MLDDIIDSMCNDVRIWVNHSKEGYPREAQDLVYFDDLWICLSRVINQVQNKVALCEEEIDFINMVKYEGRLYRIHKKYNKNLGNYGILYTDHFVSWTRTTNFADLYWLSEESNFITITAEATEEKFDIDLVGFNMYVNKYHFDSYRIGPPAILKEKEVVFPLVSTTILEIVPRKWIAEESN